MGKTGNWTDFKARERTRKRIGAAALALIAGLWLAIGLASATAHAVDTVAKMGVKRITQVSVLKSSVTALAANTGRHGWCLAATGASVVNTVPVWFTTSTAGGVTQTAGVAKGQLLGPGGPISVCDDGAGGSVYAGAVTVIALSTASGPAVTVTEW